MFEMLYNLVGGWYDDYVDMIRAILQYTQDTISVLPDGTVETTRNVINPEIWSAYVPWEHLIGVAILLTFTICIFKLLRSIICKIL